LIPKKGGKDQDIAFAYIIAGPLGNAPYKD